MFDGMVEVEEFKRGLPEYNLKCMEVVKRRSHQPTLLCIVNSSRSLKRHFCERHHVDVMDSFFKWIMDEIVKPTNLRKDQKNDYVLWPTMAQRTMPNLFIEMLMIFLEVRM